MAVRGDLKRRISSTQNTRQITKAMEAVAAAKLRKAQETAEIARPYAEQLSLVLARIMQQTGQTAHPLLRPGEGNRAGVVVIAGDRGLSGPYNANILRRTESGQKEGKDYSIIAVGQKARDFFRRKGYDLKGEYINLGDRPTLGQAQRIARNLLTLYREGVFAEIYLVYTKFINALNQQVQYLRLLPAGKEQFRGEEEKKPLPYVFEPEEEEVLDVLIPKYLDVMIYQALLEAKASEHAARRVAMSSASENAAELIEKLNLSFNWARQAAITTELLEVVSGAEALRQLR